jgi:hypothetical protein
LYSFLVEVVGLALRCHSQGAGLAGAGLIGIVESKR